MEKIFGLSKIRNRSLAVMSLLKLISKIIIIILLLAAVIFISIIISKNNFFENPAKAQQGVKEEDTTIVSRDTKIMQLSVVFNSTIHSDIWDIYINDKLIDTYETQKGVQSTWSKDVILKDIQNQTIILKSQKGREYSFDANSLIIDESNLNVQIDSDVNFIDVQIQLQHPELPNGCEATSLAMLLSAAGFETTKQEAAQAIPSENFAEDENGRLIAPNPEKFYAGQPESKNRGFYAFVPPVQQAANDIIKNAGSALKAQDLSGTSFEDIYLLLKDGYPIMLWITIDYGELKYCKNFSWLLSDTKESYLPIANLHCVVAQQKDNEDITVFDPIKGEINVEYDKLKYMYEQMGSRALYIN